MNHRFEPGIHRTINIENFNDREWEIIKNLSSIWYLTKSRKERINNSYYNYLLIKPHPNFRKMFNLQREVLAVFSPFEEIDVRSITAIERIHEKIVDQNPDRLVEVCSILISADPNVEDYVTSMARKREESRVIIPFSYKDLIDSRGKASFIVSRFRQYFYTQDFFAFRNPLRKETYLFGRTKIIHELVDKHKEMENTGVFGLRKSGKTSVLFGVQRVLKQDRRASIFIDCESLHFKKWNEAVIHIIKKLVDKYKVKQRLINDESKYQNEGNVPELFLQDMKTIFRAINKKSILLIFDEIENITFSTSISENWRNGTDFIKFWHVLRSSFHQLNSVFSYLIAGTNPLCSEEPSINNVDNPIYEQLEKKYIPPFTVEQTTEMVKELGRFMGLEFDSMVCALLTKDFGGHPFLIRQMCSEIHKDISEDRPFPINDTIYERLKPNFINQNGIVYSKMMLDVLERFYEAEYEMLEFLATEDMENFNFFASGNTFIEHLISYGIIKKSRDVYDFNTEILKNYLKEKFKFRKVHRSHAEKRQEIISRIDTTESPLRSIVKNQLKISFGEEEAKKKVIALKDKQEKRRSSRLTYQDLFNPNKSKIYLKDLFELMRKNWDPCFRNFFGIDVDIFNAKMVLINKYRNIAAHGGSITNSEMLIFRGSMEWLEENIKEYSKI